MKLYKTQRGFVAEEEGRFHALESGDWDSFVNQDDLCRWLRERTRGARPLPGEFRVEGADLLPPIGSQEVWAAGVTYTRSRSARMEEADAAGGSDFYDRVYSAPRPELFFKASPHRVAGHGQAVRLRKDSRWNVPEPELTLLVTSRGKIIGYTVGNDMSSREIEGENPLYLPQAKVYDRSCALGPGILVREEPLPPSTGIHIKILRGGSSTFEGSTEISQMKRTPQELVEYLFRESSFPNGCFLMTGTGIVPPSSFTLQSKDEIRITVDLVGTLVNFVA